MKLVWLIPALVALSMVVLYRVHKTADITIFDQGGVLEDMPYYTARTKIEVEVGVAEERGLIRKTNNSSVPLPSASSSGLKHDLMPRILALYFPQYHRDPLNDKHWGDNFTDWVSLMASPRLNNAGFEIPRPTELGYYDLSNTEPRKLQGELAKQYGIDGFIFHHYWFYDRMNPGPSLATPLISMLEDGHPNIPFFFNWCTVKWVNLWMGNAVNQTTPTKPCFQKRKGRQERVRCPPTTLQEQYFDPSREEIETHYQWLSRFFHHDNYIRIRNQPVMLLYFYDVRANPIIQDLRRLAVKDGFDGIYWIVGRSAAPDEIFAFPESDNNGTMTADQEHLMNRMKKLTQTLDLFPMEIFNQSMTYPYPLQWLTSTFKIPQWCQMGQLREVAAPDTLQEVTGIITSFDNTPRRKFNDATIYGADTPDRILSRFRTNLHTALHYSACCQRRTDDQFVAINAWNEWGEGMAIEPSDTYGRGFLEIIKSVKKELMDAGCEKVFNKLL